MTVSLKDTIDLEKIRISGQAFRICRMEDESYRFIHKDHIIYIRQIDDHKLEISCDRHEWDEIWSAYFDLDRSYDGIIDECYGRHPFIDRSIDCGRGLRILRQDPWEMLITFIISQRKSIPAIASSVESICKKYGTLVETDRERLYLFPTPGQLHGADADGLSECSLGYRVPYILDAIDRVNRRELDMDELFDYDDEALLSELLAVHGVGIKVANCVALFAYNRIGCVPIDVHIAHAIAECGGKSPFDLYGDNAGIMQQYVFYYEKNSKGLKND